MANQEYVWKHALVYMPYNGNILMVVFHGTINNYNHLIYHLYHLYHLYIFNHGIVLAGRAFFETLVWDKVYKLENSSVVLYPSDSSTVTSSTHQYR